MQTLVGSMSAAALGVSPVETIVLSDLHLADAEVDDPRRPLWKAYKRADYFCDADFAALLAHLLATREAPLELVLNGDILDFDMVTKLPKPEEAEGKVSWLARQRGLSSEAWMSVFKLDVILNDHPLWCESLRRFVEAGHRVVFIIGNHDLELHWPEVKALLRRRIGLAPEDESRLVICDWFYLSEGDSLITHGHVYDPHCAPRSVIEPFVRVRGRKRVQLPFGDMASRYMINGMGYLNPHAVDNYIMSAFQYVGFYLRYMLRGQPFLLFSWFWSAIATLAVSMREQWAPTIRQPLEINPRVRDIAERAKADPDMVHSLHALNVEPSAADPYVIISELWLDRGLMFLFICFLATQAVLAVNVVWPISPWWGLLVFLLLFPLFVLYASTRKSRVFSEPLLTEERADLIQAITGAHQVVLGHTHVPELRQVGPLCVLNSGSWSPAFAEPTCETRLGSQTFVWIRDGRKGSLWEWPVAGEAPRPFSVASGGAGGQALPKREQGAVDGLGTDL